MHELLSDGNLKSLLGYSLWEVSDGALVLRSDVILFFFLGGKCTIKVHQVSAKDSCCISRWGFFCLFVFWRGMGDGHGHVWCGGGDI